MERTLREKINKTLAGVVVASMPVFSSGCVTTAEDGRFLATLANVASLSPNISQREAAGWQVVGDGLNRRAGDLASQEAARAGRTEVNVNVPEYSNSGQVGNEQSNSPSYESFSFIDTNNNGRLDYNERKQFIFSVGESFNLIFSGRNIPLGSEVNYKIIDKNDEIVLNKSVISEDLDLNFSTSLRAQEEMTNNVYRVVWSVNDEKKSEYRIQIK